MEEAEEAWRKAIAVDPIEFEAAYSLAKLHFDDDRIGPGFAFLRTAIERLPRAKGMTPEFRNNVGGAIVHDLRSVLDCTNEPLALMAAWSGGEQAGKALVRMSSVDLRKVRNWDRLAEFIVGSDVRALSLTPDLPTDEVTQLEDLLYGAALSAMDLAIILDAKGPLRAPVRARRTQRVPVRKWQKVQKVLRVLIPAWPKSTMPDRRLEQTA